MVMDRRRKSDLLFGGQLVGSVVLFLEMALIHGWWIPGLVASVVWSASVCVGWKVDRKVWPRLPAKT